MTAPIPEEPTHATSPIIDQDGPRVPEPSEAATDPTSDRDELIAYLKKYRNALSEVALWAAADLGIAHPLVARIATYANDLNGPGNPLGPIEFQEYLKSLTRHSFMDYYRCYGMGYVPMGPILPMPPLLPPTGI